jgi:hypothetical protein
VEAKSEHQCVDIEKAVTKMQRTAKRDDAERRSLDESDHDGLPDSDDGDGERATATRIVGVGGGSCQRQHHHHGPRFSLEPHKRKRRNINETGLNFCQ